jgi:signal transduction histidine kinase
MKMNVFGEIMIVDDTPENLRLLAELLGDEGYKIRPTRDPKLALKSALAKPPDLLLLDVKMPGMNGFELCKSLKLGENTKHLPVIFISALKDMDDRVLGFEAGGVDFITKPFQREEVLARVSAQLSLVQVRKQLEENVRELSAANLELKEMDKFKNMFIATVSHELRTPLNAIIGFAGVMLQGLTGEINDKQKDYLGRVSRSGKHLLDMVTDVIDVSKMEVGDLEVCPKKFCLKEVMDDLMEITQPQMNKKQLDLDIDVISWPEMFTDSKRLFQCLLNLLSNAMKFTDMGTVTVIIREVEGDVKIAVRDTGTGIPEEDIPKLFEAFERLETSRSVRPGGTGLGLYLTKKLLLDVLQGSITVESQFGKGSTFTIQIPKEMTIESAQVEILNS